ncbi:MAG TPA: T9SS type A sorting domain-containing protein [Bacteroidales bacterium]|nr:T9SS type A sorting domain-containing protein [Bacteroidales bacterium]
MRTFIYLLILVLAPATLVAQDWNIIWQQCFGGSNDDDANDLIHIPGGYFIIGNTKSSDGDVSFNHGHTDGWLIKTDSTGNMMWETTLGGSMGENFRRIIPGNAGSYYLLGNSGSSDGNVSYNPDPNSASFWIVKIDIDGNFLWDKILGGTKSDRLWTGAATADGGIVAIGETSSDDGYVSVFHGFLDTWMVKLSADGLVESDYTIGTGWFDIGQAIIQTSDGGYLAGSNSIILQGAVGNITCIPPSYGYVTGVLTKFDADMNVQWQRCYGGNNHDAINGILEIDDGYVFVGGTESTNMPGHKGCYDVWVVRIDFDGNIVWQKVFGGSRFEAAAYIVATDDNGFIVVGSTKSNNGDVSGNHSLSEHDSDIWMFKINGDGELKWQQCFGGAGDEEVMCGVIRKSDNNFVIAGVTDFGPSYDVGCMPYGGFGVWDRDFWVFEILKTDTINAITPPASARGIRVYPNPAKDYIQFEVHATAGRQGLRVEVGEIHLFDVFVRQVAWKEITSEQTMLDVSWLPGGVYFYRVVLGEITYSGKIVIQR